LGAILVRFSGTARAALCAKRKEIKTAFDSRSIAPESLHETMFREHFSGELNYNLSSHAKRPVCRGVCGLMVLFSSVRALRLSSPPARNKVRLNLHMLHTFFFLCGVAAQKERRAQDEA
jgi:hypothetical protein